MKQSEILGRTWERRICSSEIGRNLHNLAARFLHSHKLPCYLQLKQSDTKVLSPAQDDRAYWVREEGQRRGPRRGFRAVRNDKGWWLEWVFSWRRKRCSTLGALRGA